MRTCLFLALAVLLCVCVNPIARSVLYPLEYRDVILACSNEYDVPVSLICAVIRKESRFRPDSVSHAGAYGLMQLTNPTFRQLSSELKMSSCEDIMSPYSNVRCGTYYLRYLYLRYGNWETALAAYNAGLGNVDRWLTDARYSADGKTLHTIPYSETELYVRDVTKIKELYYKIYELGS